MNSSGYRPGATVVAVAMFLLSVGGNARSQPATPQSPAPSAKPPPSTPPLHGQKLADARCASCHGPDGNSPDAQLPKIAGQKELYLRLTLHAFKSGVRKSDVMAPVASALSDAQIAELAHFYSEREVKPDPIKDKQSADLGARIYRTATKDAPACATCHNPRSGSLGPGPGMMGGPGAPGGMPGGPMMGSGMMQGGAGMMSNTAAVPDLFGQHAAYTVQRLDAFASGKRKGTVMGPIAKGMSPQDRQAVAGYLAGQR